MFMEPKQFVLQLDLFFLSIILMYDLLIVCVCMWLWFLKWRMAVLLKDRTNDLCGSFKYQMWFRKWTPLFTNRSCILLMLRIKKMERTWKHGMFLYCAKFVRSWKYCSDYLCYCGAQCEERPFTCFRITLKKKEDVNCSVHISSYMVPWPKATPKLRSLPFDFQNSF